MNSVRIFLLASFVGLPGCANFNSVYRDFNVSSGSGALIDIKQRAIIVSPKTVTESNGTKTTSAIVCAEPSPDALSAYAAEIAADANVPGEAAVQLAAAMRESSSYVGLRTQSIQLLRDSLYRLCEGYMSGALDKPQYEILVRRYQKYMVALLGIEQLTGAMRVPTVTINTEGSAEAARSISVMKEEISSIDTKVAMLEADNTELGKEKDKEGTSDERKNEIDDTIAENKKLIDSFNKDKQSISKGIENARGLAAKGSATAVVSQVGLPTQRTDQHVQAVSNVVEKIVLNIINTDDLGQLCFSYLRHDSNQNASLSSACEKYFDNLNRIIPLQLDADELTIKQIKSSSSLSDEDKKVLRDISNRWKDIGIGLKKFSPEVDK